VKHLGMYVDEWQLEYGMGTDRMDENQFQELYSEARRALPLLADAQTIRMAKAIYNLELQQPHVPSSLKLPPRGPAAA
jgi:hypothetical protein